MISDATEYLSALSFFLGNTFGILFVIYKLLLQQLMVWSFLSCQLLVNHAFINTPFVSFYK